ncbi:hypothetical protein [Streptomyces albireticuli]|uniref:Uncharacterized protein n=1 Tax=Streptomyces albireticuli TaxID=1940 RepID=A0A2A2D3H9_9ACTN|nr:hypothetical protein [Streptomyces albireticuli]MCD9141712.1 hypothetical protein [Streptomyces albireticuli]MCD9165924.1 hypothetical protein [Streptomyces albireticuli]MCD9189886.1 hypothetical protein [Streptomyces albireticuli]PAU46993.1 hypothetical protein CK936_21240 [Streptomyces albireticuli]
MGRTDLSRPLGRDGGRADERPSDAGARYAALPVRPYDLLLKIACRVVAALWSLLGMRRAADVLRHYLRGTGAPYRVDAAELLALPAVRSAAEEQLARWRAEAQARWRRGPRTRAAYPADSGWRGVRLARRGSADWWLALRGVEFRLTGTVRVAADGATNVDYRFAVCKSGNFSRGESEYGIPFAVFARLHETGLAREFTVTGEAFGHV